MNENVIRKVQKLLRLGESDNLNEAASAVAMAQSLMEKHGIEQSMIEGRDDTDVEETKEWDDPLYSSVKMAAWKSGLAGVLARNNGCYIFTGYANVKQPNGRVRNGRTLNIVGRASDVQSVRYLFDYCSNEIDRLTRKHGAGNGRTWGNNFRYGCVDAIRKAIKAEKQAVRDHLRSQAGTELVVVNQAIVRYDARAVEASDLAHKTHNLRSASSSGGAYNPGARSQGKAAGAGIYPGRGGSGSLGAGSRRLGSGR